jgi:hypothetical protein
VKRIFNSLLFLIGISLFVAFKFYEKSESKFDLVESNPLFGIAAMVGVILALIALLNIYTNYFLSPKEISKNHQI